MKMLIILVFLAAAVSVVLWRVRKADAEKALERRKAAERRQVERKEAIKCEDHVKWPVIVTPNGKQSEQEDEALPEPTMTSIEFESADTSRLHH